MFSKSVNIATLMKDKSSLRIHFLELLKKQTSIQRQAKSRQIEQKLFNLQAFQEAQTILFYASLPGEVDTLAMITKALELKKRILVPRVMPDQRQMIPTQITTLADLKDGVYSIPQPSRNSSKEIPVEEIEAVIVPGLAFDQANNRLGRGKGYYDRFLSKLSKNTASIGLAFDFQLIDRLPTEEHDVPLTYIIAN